MYNLIEYSDNYSDTSGSLWQIKRDEVPDNNADLTINPFSSSVTLLYPLKTSKNLWFSDVFRGYRNVTLD